MSEKVNQSAARPFFRYLAGVGAVACAVLLVVFLIIRWQGGANARVGIWASGTLAGILGTIALTGRMQRRRRRRRWKGNAELSKEVRQLADDPSAKIQAIALYRQQSGATLKEAKEAVEGYLANKTAE